MGAPKGSRKGIPPPNAGIGRPKGSQNKVTRQLKDMILMALDKAGGVEYLQEQAEKSPAAFMTLVGKVLPMQVTGPGDGPVQVQEVRRVIVRAGDPNG